MRSRNIFESFRNAISGIIYGLKTQRNLRIHFIAAILILFLSYFYEFSKTELLILVFAIMIVIIAEMINTAIEQVVDIASDSYHPLAKIAKDVAAGAVLVATLNAMIVGYVLFFIRK